MSSTKGALSEMISFPGVEIKDDEITNERGEISEDLSVKKLAEIVAGKKTHK